MPMITIMRKKKPVLKIQPYASINAFRLLVWAETAKQILGQLIRIFCNNWALYMYTVQTKATLEHATPIFAEAWIEIMTQFIKC